jgi:hypothetical protein
MGGSYGTYGRQERCMEGFSGWRDLRQRGTLEGIGINGRIILKLIYKKWAGEI